MRGPVVLVLPGVDGPIVPVPPFDGVLSVCVPDDPVMPVDPVADGVDGPGVPVPAEVDGPGVPVAAGVVPVVVVPVGPTVVVGAIDDNPGVDSH